MRPIPQSLYNRAEILARSHPLQVVAELIGKPRSTVSLMKKRGWKATQYGKRPVPTDFAILARHMTFGELVAHYRAGTRTVTRWLREKPRPRIKPGRGSK